MKNGPVTEQLQPFMAPRIRSIVANLDPGLWEKVEEIRLRENRPLLLNWAGGEALLDGRGKVVAPVEESRAYQVSREDVERTLQLISKCSLYAFEEEMRRGYLTIPGGHRIGLCGKAVMETGKVKLLHNISSLNFRVARQVEGVALKVLPYLFSRASPSKGNKFSYKDDRKSIKPGRAKPAIYHTLIISPPQGGKTTLLRDLCRCLSDGKPERGLEGFKIGLVDERSEIAGCYEGIPQLNVGIRTDVLDCAPKAEGMMMLLRAMSPEIIVTDEIGRDEDVDSIEEVVNAGTTVIASAHASSLEELGRRPSLRRLLDQEFFQRVIILGWTRGVGTIEKIIDPVQEKVVWKSNE